MKKYLIYIFIIVYCFTFFSSCGWNTNDKEEYDKVRVAYHTNPGGCSVLALGIEKGFFKEEGFEIECVPYTSGPPEMASMQYGNVDFGYIGPGAHYLSAKGMAKIICFEEFNNSEAIIVNKDSGINTFADLKGKKIATMLGTTGKVIVDLAIKNGNLTRDDVNIVNMDMNGCVTAIVNGSVDAICVWENYKFDAIKKLGEKAFVLATTKTFKDDYIPISSWIVSNDYLKAEPEKVQRFVNALIKTIDYWSKNTDEVCEIAANFLEIPLESVINDKDLVSVLDAEEIKEALENGDMKQWYKIQQDNFIASGYLEESIPLNNYIDFNFMKLALEKFGE